MNENNAESRWDFEQCILFYEDKETCKQETQQK